MKSDMKEIVEINSVTAAVLLVSLSDIEIILRIIVLGVGLAWNLKKFVKSSKGKGDNEKN
jgi:hypothetical protein